MTVITGDVRDIGMQPLSGALIATAVEFRTSGDFVVAPESRSWPIVNGDVSVDLLPGPTRITIQVGSHARDSFDVIVPEEPVTLARLVEDAFPWTPAVVSAVAAHRQAAEEAAGRAEAAAGAVDDAIAGAADAVVAEVEADRVAAEQAAAAASSSASAADASAGDASAAAGAAAQSASDAAGSASAAASSAGAASGSATSAAGSATDAAGAVTDARAARDAAEGHATSAAGSASAASQSASEADSHADRAETAANEFDLTATSSTLAPGAAATVTVSGDGPAYQVAFGIPQGAKGDKGDPGEISQDQLDAAVATLVDNAPEALNTLSELASALGDDPNFATTVSTQIGQRALIDGAPADYNTLGKLVTALQNHELGGSTNASLLTGALTDQVDATEATVNVPVPGYPDGIQWPIGMLGETLVTLNNVLNEKADVDHTHTKSEVGLANVDNTSDADKPVSTATQAALTPLQSRVGAAPATWRWDGTTLPTAASQVHAQARVGDFIVAPNLTTDPGWHQITGV